MTYNLILSLNPYILLLYKIFSALFVYYINHYYAVLNSMMLKNCSQIMLLFLKINLIMIAVLLYLI